MRRRGGAGEVGRGGGTWRRERRRAGRRGRAARRRRPQAKQQLPLPSVEAAGDKLPFSVEVKPKLGRHAVAKVDLPAGSLVLLEEPVATAARTR